MFNNTAYSIKRLFKPLWLWNLPKQVNSRVQSSNSIIQQFDELDEMSRHQIESNGFAKTLTLVRVKKKG